MSNLSIFVYLLSAHLDITANMESAAEEITISFFRVCVTINFLAVTIVTLTFQPSSLQKGSGGLQGEP